MKTVLITGGTGLIGRNLLKKLKEKGFDVSVLSTSANKPGDYKTYSWDPASGKIDEQAVAEADYIIHLAGANIGATKWTASRKQVIIDSRVKSGELLFKTYKENPARLKAFITASATGYYGAVTAEKIFNEDDPPANDFLGETCRLWEDTAGLFEKAGVRTVKLRTGIVLDKHDGALARLMLPVKMYAGSALGSGMQYMPWIHMDDLCGMYIKAIEDAGMSGTYNAAAPEHITNREFTKAVASALKRPFWFFRVPAFALKLILGEMSAIVLEGSRVSSEKIIKAGFSFSYPELKPALKNILSEKKVC